MRNTDINRIMTTNPTTLSPSDSIERAQSLLQSENLHHLPVVEEGKLVGLVSSADLLKCYLLEGGASAAGSTSVRAIMIANPVTLRAGSSLRDAAVKLASGGFHALPVIDTDRILIGIVTSSDLIGHLLRQLPVGDGSLRTAEARASVATAPEDPISGGELSEAVSAARMAVERGGGEPLARAILALDERVRRLQAVCKAAELYIRTGNAEREHSVLVTKLKELRELPENLYL